MRSINGIANGSNKDQREINSNKKVKIHIKTKLPATQHRRKQQIDSRTREVFSPGVDEEEEEEYNVDDELLLFNDMEEIVTKSPEVSNPLLQKKSVLSNITLCCSRSSRSFLQCDPYSSYFRKIHIPLKSQHLEVSRHKLQCHLLVLTKNRLYIRTYICPQKKTIFGKTRVYWMIATMLFMKDWHNPYQCKLVDFFGHLSQPMCFSIFGRGT